MGNGRSSDFAHGVATRVVLPEMYLDGLGAEVANEPVQQVPNQGVSFLSGHAQRIEPLVEIVPAAFIQVHGSSIASTTGGLWDLTIVADGVDETDSTCPPRLET